ncbi:hypothetical protein [Clostridium baratii]|uniref:hypothetical protein n=1 Tax=Clostridium baratii TaxID=1561 RepID=UPI0005F2CC0F|nr:hypothetical protein [Clostridium baratii]AQM59566.1 hypothetical protein NPD11_2044 [Clostridium baratii]KJU72541.1 hypothetical protein UC77_03770 [Clostridium baratii]
MGIKEKMMNQIIKIKVKEITKGQIIFEMKCLKMVSKEFEIYEEFLHKALKKLKGITNVCVDMKEGKIAINFNEDEQDANKVIDWAEEVRHIGVKNSDLIASKGKTDLEYVVKTIEKQLDNALKSYS